jgi:hypothetical protein
MRGARSPPTLPRLPTQGQNLFSNTNPGLASGTTSSYTPTWTELIPRYKHTEGGEGVRKVNSNLSRAPEANIGQTMSPSLKSKNSRKPKPMHIVKIRGIVPDGLVQARLTQFRMMTNQGRGNERKSKVEIVTTNGRTGKRKAELLDSPTAFRQRIN